MKDANDIALREQVMKYWKYIHWDGIAFLMRHDCYTSRLFYGEVVPTFIEDLLLSLRRIAGGFLRSC